LRPLRLLEKPEEIFHVVASVPDGPPSRFRWRQVLHDVTRCEGPERIAMEWWRQGSERHGGPKNPSGPARDYFRVETHQGQRFWLYRDGPQAQRPKWYLQGIFS
jgi:protein ImuB